jgi:hypothetical protein
MLKHSLSVVNAQYYCTYKVFHCQLIGYLEDEKTGSITRQIDD